MAKTVEEIANDLNISVTTVRLVLGGKAGQYRISSKTQARITNYVEQHGYVLNHSARSLKLNKTETLGLIVPNISNVFFATLAEKLELRCRRSGFQLMITCTYDDVDYENKLVRSLIARNVDGIFVIPATLENQQHHLRLVKKPLVLLDRDFGFTHNALVESHNDAGGELLAGALLDAGQTPVWFLVGDPELMRRLLEVESKPAAFIASSLPVLEGAINALREHFGYIPAEINIGTFDEHPMLSFLANNVWSMRQDEDSWAEQAFELMQNALDTRPVSETVKVPMKLIERQRHG